MSLPERQDQAPHHPTSPVWRAEELLRESDTAQIVLGSAVYTLRRTRAGKLILTK